MPAPKTRGSDSQFKVYVGTAALEKFRRACEDLGINYSEACRRLIDTFNEADVDTRSRLTRQDRASRVTELARASDATVRTTTDASLKPTPLIRKKSQPASRQRTRDDTKS